jgi:hypothetical protein
MKAILAITNLIFFAGLIYYYYQRTGRDAKSLFWISLILKISAGIALGIIYLNYYSSGDTFQYFNNAKLITAWGREHTWDYLEFIWNDEDYPQVLSLLDSFDQRALFFTKLTSILNMLTFDNYWIVCLYGSACSFFCSWFLYRTITHFFPQGKSSAFVSWLLFPSVVFWTSGLLKESFACAALFYLSGIFLKIWFDQQPSVLEWAGVLIGVMALWILKYYYAAIFLSVIFACLIYKFVVLRWFNARTKTGQVITWLAILSLCLVLMSFMHPNFSLSIFLEVIVSNNEAFHKISSANNVIHYDRLSPELFDIFRNVPWALLSGFFRPFIIEGRNAFQWVAGFENLLILVAVITSIRKAPKILTSENRILLVATISYVFILCALLALSAPNFGTLSRYRVGYLPYFLFIVLLDNPVVTWMERSIVRLGKYKS